MPGETSIGQPLRWPERWEDGCIIHLSKMFRVHEYATVQEWHSTVFNMTRPFGMIFAGPQLQFGVGGMLMDDYNTYIAAPVYPYENDCTLLWVHNCPKCKLCQWIGCSTICERRVYGAGNMVEYEIDHGQGGLVLVFCERWQGKIHFGMRNIRVGPWWVLALVRQKGIGNDIAVKIWGYHFQPVASDEVLNRQKRLDAVHFEMKQFYHFKPSQGWFGCFYKLTDISTLVQYKNLSASRYENSSTYQRSRGRAQVRVPELENIGWDGLPANDRLDVIGDVCLVNDETEPYPQAYHPVGLWPVFKSDSLVNQMKGKLDQFVSTMSITGFMNVCQRAGMFYYSINRDRLYFRHPFSAGILVDSLRYEASQFIFYTHRN